MALQKEQRRPVYTCQDCGYQSAKWMGFCPSPSCGSSTPLEEPAPTPTGPAQSPWLSPSSQPLQELAKLAPEDQRR
ncbi:MAG: hypothetical protein ACE1ZD_04295, partial [Dehalococcoidia bacterium]